MINLRPHHGLCIQHFIGKGYSKDFVENMRKTINLLESNENSKITLTVGVDKICSFCPNNQENTCLSGQKPESYDNQCLKLCNLKTGDILYWKDFKKKVQDNILKVNKLNEVCVDCEWLSICEAIYK
ncbi:DUF1284 domain-containing protein [Inconstantimicrobium mannanitabidum]|uniref:Uncharacterized protein n=1 Tax=Inconstantimicrobium mannanitabidum TaxID=1604901 RepID=A0ACB5R727_9CLOT|nr:DUF1284 domain-containing protein [Clostridium sp. TW13]GKX64988.1 hypothetical protein rsdtw13_02460 [Clostridium sp. TW13]